MKMAELKHLVKKGPHYNSLPCEHGYYDMQTLTVPVTMETTWVGPHPGGPLIGQKKIMAALEQKLNKATEEMGKALAQGWYGTGTTHAHATDTASWDGTSFATYGQPDWPTYTMKQTDDGMISFAKTEWQQPAGTYKHNAKMQYLENYVHALQGCLGGVSTGMTGEFQFSWYPSAQTEVYYITLTAPNGEGISLPISKVELSSIKDPYAVYHKAYSFFAEWKDQWAMKHIQPVQGMNWDTQQPGYINGSTALLKIPFQFTVDKPKFYHQITNIGVDDAKVMFPAGAIKGVDAAEAVKPDVKWPGGTNITETLFYLSKDQPTEVAKPKAQQLKNAGITVKGLIEHMKKKKDGGNDPKE